MRLSIPAALLAAVVVWPSGAGAQEPGERLNYAVECGGLVVADSAVRFLKSGDVADFRRGRLFANYVTFIRYKEMFGKAPDAEAFVIMRDSMSEIAGRFSDTLNGGSTTWDVAIYEQLVNCYAQLTDHMINGGADGLSSLDIKKIKGLTDLQMENLE